MPIKQRGQGRPSRGNGEVGRLRLLEKTRDALKVKPKIDLQRRELALVAGVTPALVSYYYPDKWDLLAAAAKPVVEAYTAGLRDILRSHEAPPQKIHSLAYLFIDFNFSQGYLLDFYLENSDRMARQEDVNHLREVYAEIQAFFNQLLRDGQMRGDSAAFIQSSLWSLCKYMARQPDLIYLADPAERGRSMKAQAEMVCELFLNGAATPGCLQGPSTDRQAQNSAQSLGA